MTRLRLSGWVPLLLVVSLAAVEANARVERAHDSSAPPSFAVAPFGVGSGEFDPGRGDRDRGVDVNDSAIALEVARAITAGLAQPVGARVLGPGRFVADDEFDPPPSEIRQWAYQAAVDHIVVGRVSRLGREGEGRRIEVIVRSGHSGAEQLRATTSVPDRAGLVFAAQALAREILGGVGWVDVEPEPMQEEVPESGDGASSNASSAGTVGEGGAEAGADGSGRGLDATFDLGGFSGDSPIEIKADEAEIVNRPDGRDLVFQDNVRVRQANVVLTSNRLEASYDRGQSDPRKLVALGDVFIDQGERQARCDRAIYLRETEELTCTGHAELVQGCDIVRGETIQFDLARDRARVEGAASIVIRPEDDVAKGCPSANGATKEFM